jgi:hypothetical protein
MHISELVEARKSPGNVGDLLGLAPSKQKISGWNYNVVVSATNNAKTY